MAQLTILRAPGDLVVMAFSAEPAFNDVCHEYVVGTRPNLETYFGMTHPATEADAMEPVGENHRAHTRLFCALVYHHITVFRYGGNRGKQHEHGQQHHGAWKKAKRWA
jgi:hypothetical protein